MRVLLTDRFCDRAKAMRGQTDYFDESVSGLALRAKNNTLYVSTMGRGAYQRALN
jgi:hypothetical protein